MNGGYVSLPHDMSNYIFKRILSGNSSPDKKVGYYNTLKEIIETKKPIVSMYLDGGMYVIGYIVGTYYNRKVCLGITSQLFSGSDFTTISAGVIVTDDDNVIVLKKTLGG